MNVLLVSYDTTLLNQDSDSLLRMQGFASVCEALFVIVIAGSIHRAYVRDNIHVILVGGNVVWRIVRAVRAVRNIIHNYRIDVISSQDPFESALVAWLGRFRTGARMEIQMHGDFYGSRYWRAQGFLWKLRLWIGKRMAQKAAHIRVVSQRIGRSMHTMNVSTQRVSVIPVATHTPSRVARDSELEARFRGKTVILCVSRLTREKHVDLFSRTIPYVTALTRDAAFVVVGDGPQRPEVLAVAKSMGEIDRLYLEGQVNNVFPYYSIAKIVVIPSYTEGWGRVAIEAMSQGVPVVMTDVGLAHEVVCHEENGLIVPVDDDGAMAQAIVRLCSDESLWNSCSTKARETVTKLPTPQELQARVVNVWHTLTVDEAAFR